MELGAQSSGMIGREDGWMNGGKNRDEEGDEEGESKCVCVQQRHSRVMYGLQLSLNLNDE